MTPIVRIVLALGTLCLAILLGPSFVHTVRTNRHYYRLMYAAQNNMPDQVVREFHQLPQRCRSIPFIKSSYEDARQKVNDSVWFDFLPTTEIADVAGIGVFLFGMLVLWFRVIPKSKEERSQSTKTTAKSCEVSNSPTAGQIAFIRSFNNGVVPVGLTRLTAAAMIGDHLSRLSAMAQRHRIDVSPVEFMIGSRSYREKKRLERERKRAQEKLARQKELERRKQEREALRALKAADRLNDKRIAEEEKLIKAREEARDGIVHRARNAKARAIQDLQNLVNDILADKKIEPQEVRQLKAWLMANRQSPDDFAPMIKLIDESLVDGIIDAEETQAIYEGVIDCLITLRERRVDRVGMLTSQR